MSAKVEIGPLKVISRLKDDALTTMRRNGMTLVEINKFSGHLTPEVIAANYVHAGQEQLRVDLKLLPPHMPPRATSNLTPDHKDLGHPKVAQVVKPQ